MADYTQLKADITAAIYENTEQEITGDALQEVLLEMVDDLNDGKADAFEAVAPLLLEDGELSLVLGSGLSINGHDELELLIGNGFNFGVSGELEVDYNAVQRPIGLTSPLSWDINDIALNVGAGLTVDASDNLTINLGFGLNFDSATEELLVDTDLIQEKLSATAPLYIEPLDNSISLQITDGLTVNSDGELGVDFEDDIANHPTEEGKAVSPKGVADYVAATAVCSTSIRTMVTLSQVDYDALVDKDANTFYVIV